MYLVYNKTPIDIYSKYMTDFPAQLGAVDPDVDTYEEIQTLFHTSGQKNLLVLDIDQTALLNRAQNQQGSLVEYNMHQVERNDFVYKIYQMALAAPNTSVAFITARKDLPNVVRLTKAQLARLGYTDYIGIYFRDPKEHDITAYKSDARKALEKTGYRVVLNIGDRWVDLKGGHSLHTIKLPKTPRIEQFVWPDQ